MKSSEQWWSEVKSNQSLLVDWLKDQYHGEVTAAMRIKQIFNQFNLTEPQRKIVERIAREEAQHAKWVGSLLKNRGITPRVLTKQERYWDKTLVNISSVEDAAAIGHHAEAMRLERIRVICSDATAPEDIREVFSKILPDEEGHEAMFKLLSNRESLASRANNHQQGMKALGLTI